MDFISTAATAAQDDLLIVEYHRVQAESPEFLTKYEGINQSIDMKVTTLVFKAAPEPVIALYDFIMTTFVPQSNPETTVNESPDHLAAETPQAVVTTQANTAEKIRVQAKLASVQGRHPSCLCVWIVD